MHPHYRAMIEASPFVVMATSGPDGLDVSPRGDPAGFVVVEDERTLLIPDRRGNNRCDSLNNLIDDPRIALLFMIPGVGETLRVNGQAEISCRSSAAGAVSGAGQAAALGDRGACRAGVFPMSKGTGAIGPVEPGETCGASEPAKLRHDPGGHHARPRRRGRVRHGISGTAEGDNLLTEQYSPPLGGGGGGRHIGGTSRNTT